MRRVFTVLAVWSVVACGSDDSADSAAQIAEAAPFSAPEQAQFWDALESLCGQAFAGALTENEPPSDDFDGQALVMHVRECSEGEIRVPFFVGDDRSRTWVFTPSDEGRSIRLKHDHRHEDGTEDEITQYGGDTADVGSGMAQSFAADDFTADLVPTAATNVWTVELVPGELFAYQLRRRGTDRRFRVEFDLSESIATPPAPWGSD